MNLFKINRKTIGYFVLTVLITSGLSCKKFLDLNPISQSGVATFLTTPADFEQAVNGTYSSVAALFVGNHFAYFMLMTDLRSDNTTEFGLGGGGGQPKNDIDRFTESPDNETVTAFWQESYVVIQRANAILDKIEGATMDQTLKDQYKGEAQVLRAWAYFNLVRLFGEVPLVTSSKTGNLDESYKLGRSSVEDVYNQIITDLTDAQQLLPLSYPAKEAGRVTKGTAQSLLGTVYLTQKKYPEAVTEYEKVITSNAYDLLQDYSDLFKAGMQGNKETIWQIQFKSGTDDLGSMFPNWYAPNGSGSALVSSGGVFGFNQPTDDISKAYEANDIRKQVSISDGYTNTLGDFVPAKYVKFYVERETGAGHDDSGSDWYIMRYPNVLLMCAEAINEANNGPTEDAYSYLNEVRIRAGLLPLGGLNYETFKSAIYQEERVEYPFEGHRWFDLLRTGQALDVMNSKVALPSDTTTIGIITKIQQYQLLYPVPERVVTVSSTIQQNPGY